MINSRANSTHRPSGGSWSALTIAALVLFLQVSQTVAATLPAGFSESVVAGGISRPTAMAFAPDGRLFVCQQNGQLLVIKHGALLPDPFVTVPVDSSGERGLLGVAFDPNFATNGFVYAYYTVNTTPRHNRVVRFSAKGDVAVPGSETLILRLNDLSSATNHNGGALHFGPDGKLYIAVGENANRANSQTLSNLLGKILRINADGSIPTNNPFFSSATGVNRAIWALGLRNPYTFAFQRGTNRMFINDVGQSTWEEINDGIAGSNYGWPATEGPTTDSRFRSPVFAYGRSPSTTGGCAITGGTFYNPPTAQFPAEYAGKYFFADFCSGWIRLLNPANNTATSFASGIANPVDLQVAADGTLYYLARGSGQVFRIQHNANPPPVPGPPTNDNFASPRFLPGPNGTVSASNVAATKESGEPNHAGNAGGRSVWYTWTAPAPGPVTFHTRGSSFDTLLAVYHGGSVGGLTLVAASDDISPTVRQSSVTFTATAGMVYRIAVDGYVGLSGAVRLQWLAVGAGVSDFNADRNGDLVWENRSNGRRVIWFLENGVRQGSLELQRVFTEWQIAGAADFNADGFSDLVWQNDRTGQRAVWFLRNGEIQRTVYLPTVALEWQIAGAADFDADGYADLVWENTVTGQRTIWFLHNGQLERSTSLRTVVTEWDIAGAGDFNADGHADLVWQNTRTGQRAIWLLHDGVLQSSFYLRSIAVEWEIAAAVDINGDLQADIVWQNVRTGQRAIWYLQNGNFVRSATLATIATEWEIVSH